jgi:hypothetical protein
VCPHDCDDQSRCPATPAAVLEGWEPPAIEWPEVMQLVQGAWVAALREDPATVRLAVVQIPSSMLRAALAVSIEAWAQALLALPGDSAYARRVMAQAVADHLLEQRGQGDG